MTFLTLTQFVPVEHSDVVVDSQNSKLTNLLLINTFFEFIIKLIASEANVVLKIGHLLLSRVLPFYKNGDKMFMNYYRSIYYRTNE